VALAAGRVALRLVVRGIQLTRLLRATLLDAYEGTVEWATLIGGHRQNVPEAKGSKVKSLSRLALVVGDLDQEGGVSASGDFGDRGDGRGQAWEALFPSLAHVVAWFAGRTGVPSVVLYDARGVLKSRWGAKGLRRELLRIEREEDRSVGCSIKLLSREDWDECLAEFSASSRGVDGARDRSSGGSQAMLEKWIEAYRVNELELHGSSEGDGGSGGDTTRAPSLGKPPDLIVVLSETCFTLSGFFPWHAKSAEIYQVRKQLGRGATAAELDRELEGVLRKYFKTLRRGGQ